MRIHSDVLSFTDIYQAAGGLNGVFVNASQHGSRSHNQAFEISLEGNGYRKNSGYHGASDTLGANWDEWGVYIARLYLIDPDAVWGSVKSPTYKNAADFHFKTGDRFENGELPADMLPHKNVKRHSWDGNRITGLTCSKCSATQMFTW